MLNSASVADACQPTPQQLYALMKRYLDGELLPNLRWWIVDEGRGPFSNPCHGAAIEQCYQI